MNNTKEWLKEIELQLNYVCYDKDMLPKLNKVWEALINAQNDMNWINVNDKKPNVEPAEAFGEYYESELVLVAFKHNGKTLYEVAKFTKGRDTKDGEFWESWYVLQAEDVVVNVVAWMAFPFFS